MPREGPAPAVHADRAAALRLILGREDVGELNTVSAIDLSAEMRLLHNILARIFFPKIGRFDFISERDLILMQCILEGIPLNLPRMMMAYMGETITKSKATLPYGMVLTLVFREFSVPIEDGEITVRLRHTDFYSVRSLERMGCEKVNGRWIRKGAEHRQRAEVEHTDRDETAPSSPPPAAQFEAPSPAPAPASVPVAPAAPSTIRLDDDQMRRMVSMLADELAVRGQTDVSRLSEEIARLSERVAGIEQSLPGHLQPILSEMRSVSERLSSIEASAPTDISGFTKETAILRGRMEQGISQIESLLSVFTSTQEGQLREVLTSLERVIIRLDRQSGGPQERDQDSASPSAPAPHDPPAEPSRPVRTYSRVRLLGPSPSPRIPSDTVHVPSDDE